MNGGALLMVVIVARGQSEGGESCHLQSASRNIWKCLSLEMSFCGLCCWESSALWLRRSALGIHMMITEALNILLSLVACTFICILKHCSAASYCFDNYIFLFKSWPCAKRKLLQITLKLNTTDFHHFFMVRNMISKSSCTYMSGFELSWVCSQAFILFCLPWKGSSFRYHQKWELDP